MLGLTVRSTIMNPASQCNVSGPVVFRPAPIGTRTRAPYHILRFVLQVPVLWRSDSTSFQERRPFLNAYVASPEGLLTDSTVRVGQAVHRALSRRATRRSSPKGETEKCSFVDRRETVEPLGRDGLRIARRVLTLLDPAQITLTTCLGRLGQPRCSFIAQLRAFLTDVQHLCL